MKDVLRSTAMAFLMFSVVPMPRVEWKKENMRYMLGCLPLVGVLIALILSLWMLLCRLLGFGSVLYAAGLTLLPVLISGGIHLDGFCDTVDALSSHAEPARKREILKDPHTGAFAVIYAGVWLLAHFALCAEMAQTWRAVLTLGILQVISRALGALASLTLEGSGNTGLLAAFREAARKRTAVLPAVWLVLCFVGLGLLSLPCALVSAALSCGCFFALRRMAARQFGGMSGDLAGYLITLSQLVLLAGCVFAERITEIWF